MQVSLIVGTRDSGKSTWLGDYAVRNRASGILSEKRFVEGRFIGYDARLFAGGAPGEAMPFLGNPTARARLMPLEMGNGSPIGAFPLIPESFALRCGKANPGHLR
jgi:hypothetical protein